MYFYEFSALLSGSRMDTG